MKWVKPGEPRELNLQPVGRKESVTSMAEPRVCHLEDAESRRENRGQCCHCPARWGDSNAPPRDQGHCAGAKMWLAGRSPTLAPPVPKLHSAGKGPQENDRENPTFLTPALCDLQEECALLCIFFPPCKHRPSPAGCGLSEVTPAAASGREETASGLVCSEVTHLARVRPAGIPGTDHTL